MDRYEQALQILAERFGKDSLIAVATVEGGRPHVRTVDGYYEDAAFYVVTYALSNKMRQIEANPDVAVCGEWFTAHGKGENLGYVRDERNAAIMAKLRAAFSAWYNNGHVNEEDPNTCLLRIRLTDGVLYGEDDEFEIDFGAGKA
ncbi:MAG: pyridoxamine 5'-phosphate oxidase family protein [Clostridiales bacterium]|nr:pyridoxamine 5'-phosphate oxidase family protein [Clostridiales bacterium]